MMITIQTEGAFLQEGQWVSPQQAKDFSQNGAKENTLARRILASHSPAPADGILRVTFDALASHDITYVGIVQTARASGMESFPLPYVLTNCHNSLCAVGGTINEDDHLFGLSAAQKYGGEYVPAHMAVIHQYMREVHAGCGKMILGSDSHTRYGALGTLGIGEGGPELVKQLLGHTYDIAIPAVVAVWLEGAPRPGVGPQDVALALIKAVFASGLVTNKILEFMGPGLATLSVDYRMGIDVMTTETTCLSSVWQTDSKVQEWLTAHGRAEAYHELSPPTLAWYDSLVRIDLSKVEPMIALPFHPSNAYTIREFLENADDLLHQVEADATRMAGKTLVKPQLRAKLNKGAFTVDQGIVAGCSGGMYENMVQVARMLHGKDTGNGAFGLAVYPASQPQYLELMRKGYAASLLESGATIKTAFCGPCFGAGDVPANNAFSIRHTTRNFPHREGAKPDSGQIAYVALMDARSIAATALHGGKLTPATDLPDLPLEDVDAYAFDPGIYAKRVYAGFGKPQGDVSLVFGPGIADWPVMPALPENLLLTVAAAIFDPVTTTDELIPSGETSSYRSNPHKLAEFTLSRKDPEYVGRAKAIFVLEQARRAGIAEQHVPKELISILGAMGKADAAANTGVGSVIFALKPGDGSAREQAASCQKVLGGWANIAGAYATKRYRSNLINWGMLPFVANDAAKLTLQPGDQLFFPGLRTALLAGHENVPVVLYQNGKAQHITLGLPGLSQDERAIILAGCLINFYSTESTK